MHHLAVVLAALTSLFLTTQSCSAEAEVVIFDTDMGSDCDDVGALALLHSYADAGKAEIIACVYSSGRIRYGAGVIDAINTYYGRGDIPVAAYRGEDVGDPVDKMGAESLAKNTEAFGHTIVRNEDALDPVALCRMLLAERADCVVTYITVGHTKSLCDLMESAPDDISPLSGRELIAKKVKRWVALGGLGAGKADGQYRRDWNFFFNDTAAATEKLMADFPSPVAIVDAGNESFTGKSLARTPEGNIVRVAYEQWLWNYEQKRLEDQRPSWDLATVFYAIEGVGDYLVDIGTGRLDVIAEQGSRWQPGKEPASHRFIEQAEGVDEPFADYLNRRIALPPKLSGDASEAEQRSNQVRGRG